MKLRRRHQGFTSSFYYIPKSSNSRHSPIFIFSFLVFLLAIFVQVSSVGGASDSLLDIEEVDLLKFWFLALDPEFLGVTCGSAIRLTHEVSKYKLHSHVVSYGTGSGQQSVTGLANPDDPDSFWQVKAALGEQCLRGQLIPCGSAIRLLHSGTGKFLHSHHHTAPISGQQEVSAYDGQDNGDNWKLICDNKSSKSWEREEKVQLVHAETDTYLSANKEHMYSNPIPGQIEVATSKSGGKGTYWCAQEVLNFE
ncbi:hypothetical protein G9A89_005792 [Geosiphon pyriformis]|nr:hypothetical protein G9A89_005792 [Geosiphon pyriformis]